MPVPSVDQLKRPTLEYLAAGITNSDQIRTRIARDLDIVEELDPQVKSGLARYVNNHAWALVRLQQGLDREARFEDIHRHQARPSFLGAFSATPPGRSAQDQRHAALGQEADLRGQSKE